MNDTPANGTTNKTDPSLNVKNIVEEATQRLDDLRKAELRRIDERIDNSEKVSGVVSLKDYFNSKLDDKFKDSDVKYQIQFAAAKEAVGIASTAQEKLVAQALDGTKEAINKADVATDKRFDLLADKITTLSETISKNTGAQGIYVTHTDLSQEMSKLRTDFETMLRPVITYMNSQQGKSNGLNAGWGYLIGAVGLIATILAILSFFIV